MIPKKPSPPRESPAICSPENHPCQASRRGGRGGVTRIEIVLAAGESIAITRLGQTVAEVVPPRTQVVEDAKRTLEEWRGYRARQGLRLSGLSLREMTKDDRR